MSFLATGMDLEIIILCKVSQIEKDKYMILFTCRILKNDTDEFIYKTGTDSQTQTLWLRGWGKGGRGGTDLGFGIDMYTLLHFRQIAASIYCIAQGTLLNIL